VNCINETQGYSVNDIKWNSGMKEHLKPRLLYVYCMWSEEDLHTCILKEQIKKEIKLHEGEATVGVHAYTCRKLTSMHELMLLPILTSTSTTSPTRRLAGSLKSTCRGRNTVTDCGDENLSPTFGESVRAHRDHFPGSWGADIVTLCCSISPLQQSPE
jgi:hypothetical protein